MTNLVICTAFHPADLAITKQLYEWMADIGGAKKHSCLLIPDATVSTADRAEVKALAQQSFGYVGVAPISPTAKWKPNETFLFALKTVRDLFKQPVLWLEPDATPMMGGWANGLANEYENQPFRFLGPIIKQTGQAGLPAAHLTGTAIYPNDAHALYAANPKLMTDVVAWDMEMAGNITPRASDTKLIHHFYGEQNLPPTFVEKRTAESLKHHVELSFIPKEAILFHRCKDGSLINLLRKKNGMPSKLTPVQEPVNSTPAGTVLMPAAGPNVFAVL